LNCGISHEENEIIVPADDPPDVIFRDARFENKEILDEGRKRHLEYKAALEKAMNATSADQLLENYTPLDLTPHDVGKRILKTLDTLKTKYAPDVKRNLDLLLYINLVCHHFTKGEMPEPGLFEPHGWRSVSALCGWASMVFFTRDDAPSFLTNITGKWVMRESF